MVRVAIVNRTVVRNVCKYAARGAERLQCVSVAADGEPELVLDGEAEVDGVSVRLERDPTVVGTVDSAVQLERVVLEGDREACESLLRASEEHARPDARGKVVVYTNRGGWWDVLDRIPPRDVGTVFVEGKDAVVEDLRAFLGSEADYGRFGIPYRRNYLFHGPPGTGKTSLTVALVSHFRLSVAFLSLGSAGMDDAGLFEAVGKLPKGACVVLEDADVIIRGRTTERTGVTYQGVLNVLDGIASKHGCVTFVTTNHRDQFDAAMLRRIDYELAFQPCTGAQRRAMAASMCPRAADATEVIGRHRNVSAVQLQRFLFAHRDAEALAPFEGELRSDEAHTSMFS